MTGSSLPSAAFAVSFAGQQAELAQEFARQDVSISTVRQTGRGDAATLVIGAGLLESAPVIGLKIKEAARRGLKVWVAHQNRYNPALLAARRAVQDGRLGKLVLATVASHSPEGYLEQYQESFRALGIGEVTELIAAEQPGGQALAERCGQAQVERMEAVVVAGKSVADLVEWSGGLYNPPAKFRSW